MPTRDSRLLPLAILILAGLQAGLPWADGGRSPAGQASLVLLIVFAGIAGLFARANGALIRPSPLLLLAGLLVGVSTLHTIYPDRTVQSLLLLLAYLLAGTLAAQSAREIPWAESVLLTAIFASGGLVTTVGLFHLFRRTEGGVYANLLTGPFVYPNAMAGFLLVSGGAALAMVWANRGPLVRLLAIGAGILAMMGLFLTRSRGGLLAAMAGGILWLAVQRQLWRSQRRLWVWLVGFGVLFAIVWLHGSTVGDFSRIWSLRRPMEDSSLRWRLHILRWTWTMVWEHPWWGVGPGAFPVALTHYQRLPYVSGQNPHNLYLEIAAEYGFPAGVLMLSVLGGYLYRVIVTITRASTDDPARRRLAILLATLVAFLVHSLGDLDWSFPAIALTAATTLGLTVAHLPGASRQGHGPSATWRMILIILLVAAAILALTRYYASSLVTWGRQEFAAGETARSHRDLMWALRLNPLSFPAHQWMAWTQLRSGDLDGAVEAAERAARTAPSDPNSLFLAGEINAAVGRWDSAQAWFRRAVDLAPATQLRFYAGLVETSARGGKEAETRRWYDRAVTVFSPEHVLQDEARCLAPGDRYLLARMSRIVAPLYEEADDRPKQQALLDRAQLLARPDPRGICASRGRPGQTSPEAAAVSFWKTLTDGGRPLAEGFLAPNLRRLPAQEARPTWGIDERPLHARLVWVAALTGGERQASLRSEVVIELPGTNPIRRCTQMDLRIIKDDWFVETLPVLEPGPCQP